MCNLLQAAEMFIEILCDIVIFFLVLFLMEVKEQSFSLTQLLLLNNKLKFWNVIYLSPKSGSTLVICKLIYGIEAYGRKNLKNSKSVCVIEPRKHQIRQFLDFTHYSFVSYTIQVMVMTAEILNQLLLKKYISLNNLALLILDECHHAVEDHPMRQVLMLLFSTIQLSVA